MTLMEETSEKHAGGRRGMVWDPRHASLLHVISEDAAASVYQLYAHVGVAEGSDPTFPTLLRLISDYEAPAPDLSIRSQSQQYRASIQECLDAVPHGADRLPRDLLSQILAVFRLAEIYVLPATAYVNEHQYHSSRDWLECPGIATADTVRFLRRFLLPPLEGVLDAERALEDEDLMMEEEEEQRMSYPSDVREKGAYWSLVWSLVRRGCLATAWDVLQTHSMYTTAVEGGRFSTSEEERAWSESMLQNWQQIGSVLSTAPLPGGRSTEHDDGATANEVGASHADSHLTIVPGMDVSYMDYVLWDIPSDDQEDEGGYAGDYPILFTPELAMQKYKLWRDFAMHVRQTNRLCREISQIDHMFQLLCGDWSTSKMPQAPFSSWAEQLCAELLYRTPDLRPRSIAARTLKLRRAFQEEEQEFPMVSIMQGNAGRAITELHELGGRSGAALPRTLVRQL
jgi:Nup85 Nucleoporin